MSMLPFSNGLKGIIQTPPRKVEEQQHQDQVSDDVKAEEDPSSPEDLRKVEQEMVAANNPEVAIAAVEERWTTFEEEKLATEQMLRRFGAQAVLNKLGGEVSARTNLLKKLALHEQEVKLGQQIIKQKNLLVQSKQALTLMSKKVKYNICHKFRRGGIVEAFKYVVDKEVLAAKQRLGLHTYKQFDMKEMLATITRLAPDGKYSSSKPAPVPTATSRPWRRRPFAKEEPRVRYFPGPVPSVPIQQRVQRSSHSAPAVQPGYRGDQCIVSYGDVIAEEQFCDFSTQFEQCAEYDWDGDYDFAFYEEEVEVDVGSSDIIWEDPGYGTAEVVPCIAADEVVCCVPDEVVSCFDVEEVVSCSDAEFSSYDADEEDCGYHDAELEESGYSGEDFYAY